VFRRRNTGVRATCVPLVERAVPPVEQDPPRISVFGARTGNPGEARDACGRGAGKLIELLCALELDGRLRELLRKLHDEMHFTQRTGRLFFRGTIEMG
jgi:hypothetical protein